ncbi:heavy metal transporter [Streptomyces gibsoniae]|uniref:Heavy metal transporter n=1 Tax=Streptomyces gibsoniae TaxID=3075529 RepID=A0ABU2TPC9_9ACTN|nr:heavy metal transporter [Streptomyces sp. DSM 41699]MDT0462803.1 heavy metal transporter [Streptomyces sp. DSM 41699]
MSEPSPKPKRRGRLLRFGAALVVLFSVAGYLAVQYLTGPAAPSCKVISGKADGASYSFTPEQAVNAATISAVGTTRGLPERAVTIAIATALQESGLRNIQHGDRDSLGLFQQRPSQGWGSEKQIMDPTYAATMFYDHLAKVPDYTELPLTVAAQRVQRSGYPEAYAKHEPDATLLAAALTGRSAATLTCQGRPAPATTGGTDAVRAALVRDFGRDVLQTVGAEVATGSSPSSPTDTGPAADTSTATSTDPATDTSTAEPSTGSDALTIPVPRKSTASGTARQRGWELAHWAVANSSALHIARVSFEGREWSRGGFASEWRTTTGGSAAHASVAQVRIVTGE